MRRVSTLLAATFLAVFVSAVPASAQNSLAWSGFYVGGHVGFGVSNPDSQAVELVGVWNGTDGDIAAKGGINWGGLVGFQRALSTRFVVAAEFGIGMNGYSGDGAYDLGSANDTKISYDGGLNWTALGRFGVNFGQVMPYFTAGVVGISTDVNVLDDCNTGNCGGGLAEASASGSARDFTWGFGAEFGLGNHPVTIRGEWLLADFRSIIDATDSDEEVTWRFDPHYPKGVVRILVNWRIGGSTRR